MRREFRIVYNYLVLLGIDPIKTVRFLKGIGYYFRDFVKLNKQRKGAAKDFAFGVPYPCLSDRFSDSGSAKGHYFHQDLLIARRIYTNRPSVHVDVGSRIDGFVAHVASFRPINVIDIRPLSNNIPNIKFIQANLIEPVAEDLVGYCDSLSCLHAIEHFGLGRYGDPVNYDGYLSGLCNLNRILKKGGKLYFSVPIGPQRIEFNAHRIFAVAYLIEYFNGTYCIDQFSFVDDHGYLHENIILNESDVLNNFGCACGCGIFEMTKL